jgi:hypothetical protein
MAEFGSDNRLYFDDLQIGQRFTSRAYVVDEEQIKSFARQFDPQPFTLIMRLPKTPFFQAWRRAAGTLLRSLCAFWLKVACRSLAVSSGLAARLIGLIQPAPATLCKLKVKSWRFDLRNPDQIVESRP